MLELTGQLGDAGLAVLRVAGEVAGGDRLSGGHARALLRGQNGDAVFRLDHRFVAHDEARRIIAGACLIFHHRRGGQRLVDGGHDAVAEIGCDRDQQDPQYDGRVMLALFHSGSFAAQGAGRLIPASG